MLTVATTKVVCPLKNGEGGYFYELGDTVRSMRYYYSIYFIVAALYFNLFTN